MPEVEPEVGYLVENVEFELLVLIGLVSGVGSLFVTEAIMVEGSLLVWMGCVAESFSVAVSKIAVLVGTVAIAEVLLL